MQPRSEFWKLFKMFNNSKCLPFGLYGRRTRCFLSYVRHSHARSLRSQNPSLKVTHLRWPAIIHAKSCFKNMIKQYRKIVRANPDHGWRIIFNSIYNFIGKSLKGKIRYICCPSLGQKSMKYCNLSMADLKRKTSAPCVVLSKKIHIHLYSHSWSKVSFSNVAKQLDGWNFKHKI